MTEQTTTEDADWIRAFGTSDTRLEPIPKPVKKRKLTTAQREAAFLLQQQARQAERPQRP